MSEVCCQPTEQSMRRSALLLLPEHTALWEPFLWSQIFFLWFSSLREAHSINWDSAMSGYTLGWLARLRVCLCVRGGICSMCSGAVVQYQVSVPQALKFSFSVSLWLQQGSLYGCITSASCINININLISFSILLIKCLICSHYFCFFSQEAKGDFTR